MHYKTQRTFRRYVYVSPSEPSMLSFLGRVLVGSTVTSCLKPAIVTAPDPDPLAEPAAAELSSEPPTPGMGMLVSRMAASRGDTSFRLYLTTLRHTTERTVELTSR